MTATEITLSDGSHVLAFPDGGQVRFWTIREMQKFVEERGIEVKLPVIHVHQKVENGSFVSSKA